MVEAYIYRRGERRVERGFPTPSVFTFGQKPGRSYMTPVYVRWSLLRCQGSERTRQHGPAHFERAPGFRDLLVSSLNRGFLLLPFYPFFPLFFSVFVSISFSFSFILSFIVFIFTLCFQENVLKYQILFMI